MQIKRTDSPFWYLSQLRRSFADLLLVSVILLTLVTVTTGCAILGRHAGETCNTRAYARTDFESFISTRFARNSPVRVAVVPFVTQANLAARDDEQPGLGNELAWSVQRELVGSEVLPIVEVFNRQDWPGKKAEFFTGNFGALARAKDAGYDFVLVGYMDPIKRVDTWVIHTKLIEVESGISLWYGTSTINTIRKDMLEVSSTLGLTTRRPDLLYGPEMLTEAARCIAFDMLHDPLG